MDTGASILSVGAWVADRSTGELRCGSATERLEPKVMDLLFLLASRPGQVFSKDEIMERLWPGVIVGEDTLARTVSRLRKVIGDETKAPRYIETLPKRGYRLIAAVGVTPTVVATAAPMARLLPWRWAAGAAVAVALVVLTVAALRFAGPTPAMAEPRVLSERATDFYFQFTRADNEAATALFQRILTDYPDYAPALAGIANALVQKAIRWQDTPGARSYAKLGDALHGGGTQTAEAQMLLTRAQALATQAVALAPNDAGALKALGFVRSARGDFDGAIAAYQQAVSLDPDAWGPLINIGDNLEISGRTAQALPYFEAAYAAMTRVYDRQSARVRPWHAELGVLIGDRYRASGKLDQAQAWYRRVLATAPLHVEATTRLASLLRQSGDADGATALCENLRRHVDAGAACGMR